MEQFAERANQSFAGLLGDSHGDTLKLPNQWVNAIEKHDNNINEVETDEKESLDHDFKKPKISGLKRNKDLPGHLLNPEKWTKYDLSDVRLSSDTTNAQSALSFLNNLKKRKHSGDIPSSKELEDGSQIKFNKPVVNEHGEEHGGPDGSYSSFTVVMPEYTIGSKKKKVIKKTCVDTRNSSAHRMLTLSHLEDNEDEA